MNYHYFTITWILLAFHLSLLGQTGGMYIEEDIIPFDEQIDHVIAPLDKGELVTGLLYDRSAFPAMTERWDGLDTTQYNPVNPVIYGMLYANLFAMQTKHHSPLPDPGADGTDDRLTDRKWREAQIFRK